MGNVYSDTDFEDSTKGEITANDDWSKSATGFSVEESAYNIETFDTKEDSEDGRKFGVREDYDYRAARQASPVRIKRQSPVRNNRIVDSSDIGERAGWEIREGTFDGREYEYSLRNSAVKKKSPTSPILAQIRSEIPQDDRKHELFRNGSSFDDDKYESWYNVYKDRYKTGLSPISLASRFWTTISGTDEEDEEGVETTLKPRYRSPHRNRQSRKVLSPSNRSATSPNRSLSPTSRVWTTVDGDKDDEGIETTHKLRKSTALADSSENEWSGSLKSSGIKDPPARERGTDVRSPKSPHVDNLSDQAMKDLIETFARELARNIAREGTPSNFNIFEEINKRVAQSAQSPTSAEVTKATPSTSEQKASSATTDIGEGVQIHLDTMSPGTVDVEKTNFVSPKTEGVSEQETADVPMSRTQVQDNRIEETTPQDTAAQNYETMSPHSKFSLESLASLVTTQATPAVDKLQLASNNPAAQTSAQATITQSSAAQTTPTAKAAGVPTQPPVQVPMVEEEQPQEASKQQDNLIKETTPQDTADEAMSPHSRFSLKSLASLVTTQTTPSVDKLQPDSNNPAARMSAQAPVTQASVEQTTPAEKVTGVPTHFPVQVPVVEEVQPQEVSKHHYKTKEEETEEDELAISPAASALEAVRAASPLVTLTSEDFEDVDMKFVQQYDKTFEAFVEAHPTLSQENVDMIMYLRVAKLQKLLEVVDDLEDAFHEKLEKLRTQKKVMTANYQRELLNATKEKAGREIHLRQELRMIRESTQLLEAKLKWAVFLKHKSRADNQFDLLQHLWTKTVNPEDPISALPDSLAMQQIRDATTVIKPEKDEVDVKSKADTANVKISATASSFQEEVTKLELEVSSVTPAESDANPEQKEGDETPFVTDANMKVVASSFENDLSNKEIALTKKEMKEVKMDNAFLHAEISVLENKLAYVKSKSHKDMWVDTMFHQLGPSELARFKKKFEKDVGVPV